LFAAKKHKNGDMYNIHPNFNTLKSLKINKVLNNRFFFYPLVQINEKTHLCSAFKKWDAMY